MGVRRSGRARRDGAGGAGRTVYLVDASPYVFRAYFSTPASLVDPEGRPVNAVHGFATFLLRLLREEEPSHLGVAFDESLTTCFRNEYFPEYKAQREPPPPELEAQLRDCRAMAEAMGAATWADLRYEADDLIASAARPLTARGHRVVVVSGDKDLAQLVGPRVTLYDFAKGERLDAGGVERRLGIPPGRVVDFLALAGDAVDNIPGVRGVGAKTAVALLQRFESLDEIYERIEEIERLPLRGAAAVRRRLEVGRESAYLSRRLARVATNAPVRANLRTLAWKGFDESRLARLLERLGFTRLAGRLGLSTA